MLKYTGGIFGDVRVYHEGDRTNQSWAEFDLCGKMVKECKRGSFLAPGLTDDEIAEARRAISDMRTAPYESAYLRFNQLPAGNRSKNHATGELESGVSCYALAWDMTSQCYKRTGGGLDGAMIAYAIQGTLMYFITGNECGTGSDGEPLLSDAKVLGEARFDTERGGYVLHE